jgi:hypothetical protein
VNRALITAPRKRSAGQKSSPGSPWHRASLTITRWEHLDSCSQLWGQRLKHRLQTNTFIQTPQCSNLKHTQHAPHKHPPLPEGYTAGATHTRQGAPPALSSTFAHPSLLQHKAWSPFPAWKEQDLPPGLAGRPCRLSPHTCPIMRYWPSSPCHGLSRQCKTSISYKIYVPRAPSFNMKLGGTPVSHSSTGRKAQLLLRVGSRREHTTPTVRGAMPLSTWALCSDCRHSGHQVATQGPCGAAPGHSSWAAAVFSSARCSSAWSTLGAGRQPGGRAKASPGLFKIHPGVCSTWWGGRAAESEGRGAGGRIREQGEAGGLCNKPPAHLPPATPTPPPRPGTVLTRDAASGSQGLAGLYHVIFSNS